MAIVIWCNNSLGNNVNIMFRGKVKTNVTNPSVPWYYLKLVVSLPIPYI